MGTQQSNNVAAKFFVTIGGDLQGLASGAINMINMPAQIMGSISGVWSSSLSGITLPIVIIGGLYLKKNNKLKTYKNIYI